MADPHRPAPDLEARRRALRADLSDMFIVPRRIGLVGCALSAVGLITSGAQLGPQVVGSWLLLLASWTLLGWVIYHRSRYAKQVMATWPPEQES
jgi:hypothetical protein